MALPTPVNGQITDSVTRAYTAGGDAALTTIIELLDVIAHGLSDARGGIPTPASKSAIADEITYALAKAECELHEILQKT